MLKPQQRTLYCTHKGINRRECYALWPLYASTMASSHKTCGHGRQLEQQTTQRSYLVGRPSRRMTVLVLDPLSCDLLSRLGVLSIAHKFGAEWSHAIRAAPVQIAQGPRSEPEAPRGAFCLRYGRPLHFPSLLGPAGQAQCAPNICPSLLLISRCILLP